MYLVYLDVGYTNEGEECKNRCEKIDGYLFIWCWTVSDVPGSWGYCTPTGNILGKRQKGFQKLFETMYTFVIYENVCIF